MKEWKQCFLRVQEDGMEAIEGLLVILLMLFVLLYIWAYGFLLYQNWAVQYVATDTASRIAQTYAYPHSDPITGFISSSIRAGLSPYRYSGSSDIESSNANRAEKYAEYQLKQTGFTRARGMHIETKTVYDTVAQRHIEVTVTANYEIPFGFAMKYFGQSPYRTFTATGRAVCLDIQHYIYTIKTVDSFEDAVGIGAGSKYVATLEKTIKLVKSFAKWMQDTF